MLSSRFFLIWQCEKQNILLQCNCTNKALAPLFPNAPQCLTLDEIKCAKEYFDKNFHDDFSLENCLEKCPMECYLDQFEIFLNTLDMIPNFYLNHLSEKPNLLVDFDKELIHLKNSKNFLVNRQESCLTACLRQNLK